MCARRVLRSGPVAETLKGPAAKRRDRRQGVLPFDPMPDRIEPCLPLAAGTPPEGENWAYEVKWDGYRIAVHVEPGSNVRIITRGGHDWTKRFPAIAHDALDLPFDSAIIDGEAVLLDERGGSDFGALQKALGGRGGKRFASEALLYAFDLLYLNGHDLRALTFDERRNRLTDVLQPEHNSIRLSREVVADGATFHRLACEMGLEGIVAKRRDTPYRSGRGGEWLKIKCVQSETFLVIGYEPLAAALGGIGRILVAAIKGVELVYVGGVGTGFSHAGATALKKAMDKLAQPRPPIPLKRSGTRWVQPILPVEILFSGWTDDGKLRHPSYKGLREDAEMGEIYQIV